MKNYRAEYIINFKHWDEVPQINDFSFPWNEKQAPYTSFQAFHNGLYLHFRFVADCNPTFVYEQVNHKLEVIKSERVEIFLRQNNQMSPYYCLEMDPKGRILDYYATHYRQFDYTWKWPENIHLQTNVEPKRYCLYGKISLAVMDRLGLLNNNRIEAGLFRAYCTKLEGDRADLEWISWVNPESEKPDFHIPSAFGTIQLSEPF